MGVLILINTLLLVVLLWWFLTKAAPMPAGALWGCRLGVLLAVLASHSALQVDGDVLTLVGDPLVASGLEGLVREAVATACALDSSSGTS